MANTQKHKVFISYHHCDADQEYRKKFEELFSEQYDIIVSKAVQDGDIGDDLKTETVRQKIRDEYLRDSTVTVVLIGAETWKRKHVDWEISASIRKTEFNSRSGLIGIILPTYPRSNVNEYNPKTIPPRLYDNINCDFATIHNWSEDPAEVQSWIHNAFKKRDKEKPDNSFPSFINNRSGNEWNKN